MALARRSSANRRHQARQADKILPVTLQDVLKAAGKLHCLGPLDENDPEAAGDKDESDDQEPSEDADADQLADALGKTRIA